MRQLNKDVLEKLRSDDNLVFAIAQGMKKKFDTVTRWVKNNDTMLTSTAVVLIIQKETGLSEQQILEKEPAAATA